MRTPKALLAAMMLLTLCAATTAAEDTAVTTLQPDTIPTFWANSIDTLWIQAYLGDFAAGYGAGDVETATVSVTGAPQISSTAVLTSYPGFDGEVLEIVFSVRAFILDYGLLFDTTTHDYTVSGSFTDATGFSAVGSVTFLGHRCGDVNADRSVDIGDLVTIVNHAFKGGPAPVLWEAANVDGRGGVDITDAVYLVNYMFKGGPSPDCP
jgi:hypothetical protein